ncbi:hypothetical protein PIROE2DRAFT_3876 [Piromyces sp. E2]|nr:hypothetical protein PIROE2DRAFT_3876 [Piromyces sp. E2]|eukprot:OUM68428.1 hypothetical protein PIROE2DRAFT_3876 [Piromyces sp. E2]
MLLAKFYFKLFFINIDIYIDSTIIIHDDYYINNYLEKLSIIGNGRENSILEFSNKLNKFYFSENVQEIELKNITIIGNLFFDNNIKVNLDSISISGYIDSNFEKQNEKIKMYNVLYNGTLSSNNNKCINLGGNIEIEKSKFYGNWLCKERLLKFNGLNKYNISIKNSYFSGEYQCSGLIIDKGNLVDIDSCVFEKVFNSNNDLEGTGIKIINSKTFIRYSTFKNIYGVNVGGALYMDNVYEFEADHLDINNVTSSSGSFAYITSELTTSTSKFRNIRQYNSDFIGFQTIEGFFLHIEGNNEVTLDNYYAENINNLSYSFNFNAIWIEGQSHLTIR